MRQYAGFGTAASTNERFKFLLEAGQTGLSCAFDLPTQMGYDSDHPRAEGEVGKVGVAISCMADMRQLLADLPLDKVSTSMTINSTGAILLLMYELVAEEQGVPAGAISGTIQNDLLKDDIDRGTYNHHPKPNAIIAIASEIHPTHGTSRILRLDSDRVATYYGKFTRFLTRRVVARCVGICPFRNISGHIGDPIRAVTIGAVGTNFDRSDWIKIA